MLFDMFSPEVSRVPIFYRTFPFEDNIVAPGKASDKIVAPGAGRGFESSFVVGPSVGNDLVGLAEVSKPGRGGRKRLKSVTIMSRAQLGKT